MTLLQLEIFIAIYETGSFTKAAERLNLSQSAISHSLQALESELGIGLFDRNRREVRITVAGASFLSHAREAINQTRIIEQLASRLTKLETGKIKIGSFPSFTANLLPELLVGFQEKYPSIDYLVREGDYYDIAAWVKIREVDVGFSIHPQNDLHFFPLLEDPIYVVMSESHRLAGRSALSIEHIANENYINVSGYEQLLDMILKAAPSSVRLNATFDLSNTNSILSVVRAGLAVTLLPHLAIPSESTGIAALPLTPAFHRSIGLVTRAVSAHTPAARTFTEFVLERYR
ncbi:LysR family transcriptional regulator [Paenibacillus soyae]|uniref:LysR family transcriptional regulator n=1 Tax=Paenibacillus soyae TaxID=2969249 RepID=A0A9X2MSC8_9BACL|nr:LysR family transcriptional regulator [Paenibacillus soyae]MCR2806006.1 LysR family transcriptional regulator [Paenibacillus soyae]